MEWTPGTFYHDQQNRGKSPGLYAGVIPFLDHAVRRLSQAQLERFPTRYDRFSGLFLCPGVSIVQD
jgi:hypothetical protein